MAAGIVVGILVCGLTANLVASDSCVGRCGQVVNSAYNCQCNTHCTRYSDCCTDYAPVCLGATCSGRCDQTHDNTKPCQCNSACVTYGDCCTDYNSLCVNGGGSSVPGNTPGTLSDAIQTMWDRDTNRLLTTDITINTYGTRLFTSVKESKLAGPTFQAFINLLDNYETMIGQAEYQTSAELQEIDTFINVIMQTDVMSLAYSFLELNGKVASASAFQTMFRELWFNLYGRSSSSTNLDSSGFEHVLVGETKSTTVSGFHSWVQFYLQEKNGHLQYSNMVATGEPSIKGARFTWNGREKTMGSFFLGTSPEFDMAVYTLCAVMHQNSRCTFNLQGASVSIQTYDVNHKSGNQIGTAYPAI